MNQIFSIALKDLKILLRDKASLFFVVGFPIVMGLFFGMMYGGIGGSSGTAKLKFAVVDQDKSENSAKFIERLKANENLAVETIEMELARESVRKGQRVGMLVIPTGYGESAGVFWEEGPALQLGMDPSRQAEAGMIQGYIMEASGQMMGERFNDPDQFRPSIKQALADVQNNPELDPINRGLMTTFLNSVDTMIGNIDQLQQQNDSSEGDNVLGDDGLGQANFQFAKIETLDITRKVDEESPIAKISKAGKGWAISFPQAMMWGVLSCVAGFSISIARERTLGTLVRLEAAPLTRLHILSGKALACFLAVVGVIVMMTVVGVALGLRPASYPKLVLAAVCVAVCFVGVMMVLAVLGKTEQAVGGSGWAVNMVMAMLGGCMVPLMFMPAFLQKLSFLSPIRYGIIALEGAIWREFSFSEMLQPCLVLVIVGICGVTVGSWILSKRSA